MAESVQYYLERMIPELEGLEKKHIFSPIEIKSIIKKRTNFEYALQRRIKQKIDFLRAIEYEINLEELRRKRVNKLGLADALRGDNLQYSGAKRIYSLFRRATIKFKADISLWLQYIDYAKRNRANNILSSIFVQAIQYHPKNASLWIMAATWENDDNSNTGAARVLFQRAIRLMPENQQLWHEYFRLELNYIEKIKIRRRLLGIHNAPKPIEPQDEDDNTIQLPAITGEDIEAFNSETDKKQSKLTEAKMASLEEENNPILQGLLAKIIYDNAIEAIPRSIEFRQRFIEIYKEFTDPKLDHIYQTIERDLADLPEARAFLAIRPLSSGLTLSDPLFVQALKEVVASFESAIQDLRQTRIWELYLDFLMGWADLASEPNLKLYLTSLIRRTFKACQKADQISASLYVSWLKFEPDLARANRALNLFPTHPELWLQLLALTDEPKGLVFNRALEINPDSLSLWLAYRDWIVKEGSDEVFLKACEKVTELLPSVVTEDRQKIRQEIQVGYVRWAAARSIEEGRAVYRQIERRFYPTFAFYKACVELENEFGSGGVEGQESVEYLYDKMCRFEDHKEESYISYLAYLYSQKKLQKANQVYHRACKEVSNTEMFDIQIQKLRSKESNL